VHQGGIGQGPLGGQAEQPLIRTIKKIAKVKLNDFINFKKNLPKYKNLIYLKINVMIPNSCIKNII
jgi:hypothetical protein